MQKRPPARGLEASIAAQFDRVEARFHRGIEADDVRVRSVLAHLGDVRGRTVLDLGCGKGRFVAHLRDQGADVLGIDRSRGMLGAARTQPARALIQATATRLPLADRSIDAVVAVEAISHFPRLPAALTEIARVLRPGGRVVLLDKNRWSLHHRRPWLSNLLLKRIDERRGRWMYPEMFGFRERWFWAPGLRHLLRRWFADVRTEYLLSALERESPRGAWLFRSCPLIRYFVVWSGVKS